MFSSDKKMNPHLIPFLLLLFSSHAQSVLLPCSCPTAAVQQLINASTKVAHHTSAQSVGARPSSRCFKHTWTRPVCTLHAALDTGVISFHVVVQLNESILHCHICRDSVHMPIFPLFLSLQMFQLPGGVWRTQLSQVSHPTGSL